ncbi:hypothetical protein M9Y10_005644 [Tritrichomonas musculus]|uniref:Ras-GEF domain-containing protein n=1 Tax=Tritrichomonas musculus TaxID=1915356 RepID=A0ABR2JDA4_9EUKA
MELPTKFKRIDEAKDLGFLEVTSFKCLGLYIFHPSLGTSAQHSYHKFLVFAWHNLGRPLVELVNLAINIINEYQSGLLKGVLDIDIHDVYQSGLDFAHTWICTFLYSDFIGPENEENRENIKDLLRKIAELDGEDFDGIAIEEEEEDQDEKKKWWLYDEKEEEEKEEPPLICDLDADIGQIKLYLDNLDQNLPVVDLPLLIQPVTFTDEEFNNDKSIPFPLRADSDVISHHFFYTGLRIYNQIKYHEYINCCWQKDNKESTSPHIVELENHFQKTAAIITDSILTTDDLELRIHVIEKWIDIMEAALNENNYLFLFEIDGTLSKPPISKLKVIWRDVNPESMQKYRKLQEITSTYKRYSTYKSKLSKLSTFRESLPYINPWLTEMWLISNSKTTDFLQTYRQQWSYFNKVEFLRQPWGVDMGFLLNKELLDEIDNYIPILNDDDSINEKAQFAERSAILSPIKPSTSSPFSSQFSPKSPFSTNSIFSPKSPFSPKTPYSPKTPSYTYYLEKH